MHVSCPQCRNPIELVADDPLDEVSCPSCGSSFSLFRDDETLTHRREPTTIGHFTLIERLGVGAFGAVWKARDTELDRHVAVKIPRQGQLNAEESEKFLREARAAAQIRHPNIVSVHEVGREDGSVYIVADLIDGLTLRDWLTGNPPTPKQAAELCGKIAAALHHAHENGVIHRDLKPSNVMIDREGEPHLMDFGLAKREAGEITMTLEGQVLGTPAYMAPEQARGEGRDVDRRADVYSLGVVLFEMLTGDRPFRGNSRMLLHQVLTDEAPSPRKLNATIPRDLETICLKCLEKHPAKRYATAQLLAEDLQRYLNGEPVHARPITPLEHAWRWCGRNAVVASLAASLFLALAIGIAAVTWKWREAEASAEREGLARASAQEKEGLAREAAAREADANAKLQRFLYAAQMNLALHSLGRGNLDRSIGLLEQHRPQGNDQDLRGFEWEFLWDVCHAELAALRGHTGGVHSVAYSADGDYLATASEDGTVRVWSVQTGSVVAELAGNAGEVKHAAFSPHGNYLASAGSDGSVILWNWREDKQTGVLLGHAHRVNSVAFAPNKQLLVSGCDGGEIRVWQLRSGRLMKTLVGGKAPVGSVAFSPDGSFLYSAEREGSLRTAPEKSQRRFDERDAPKLRVWDGESFEQRHVLVAHSGRIFALANIDNDRLITAGMDSAGRGSLVFWNGRDGKQIGELDLQRDIPLGIALTPDRKILAIGFARKVALWRMDDADKVDDISKVREFAHTGLVYGLAFAPDGKTFATGAISGETSIKLWDVEKGKRNPRSLSGHTGWVSCLAFDPKGRRFATASRTMTPQGMAQIIIWDPESGEPRQTLQVNTRDVYALDFSPEGDLLAAACDDKTIQLWDVEEGTLLAALEGHEIPVSDVAFSADGARLLSGDGEYYRLAPDGSYYDTYSRVGTVNVWNVAKREVESKLEGLSGPVSSIAFSPKAAIVAISCQDGTARLYDTHDYKLVRTIESYAKSATSLAYSPDGRVLAIGGRDGGSDESGMVKLFNTDTWNADFELVGHAAAIRAMSFSPDGETLATGTWDGTLRFWDPHIGQQRLALRSPQTNALAFSPDGSFLATGHTNKTVRLWFRRKD